MKQFQLTCNLAISTCIFVILLFNALTLSNVAILVDFQHLNFCIVQISVLYKVDCNSRFFPVFPNFPVLIPFPVLTENRELWKPQMLVITSICETASNWKTRRDRSRFRLPNSQINEIAYTTRKRDNAHKKDGRSDLLFNFFQFCICCQCDNTRETRNVNAKIANSKLGIHTLYKRKRLLVHVLNIQVQMPRRRLREKSPEA